VISAIGESGDLLSWRSSDGGRTWTPGPHINDAAGSAREGLHAMAAGPGGFLFAAWLDLRAGRTRLVGARSTDGGRTWSANTEIYASPDGSICECCHPSAAIDSRGTVYVMWRNWLSGARDMYLSRSLDGKTFSPAQKLGEGTWPLNACPMDGGGLAVSPEVITVWRRDGAVFSSRPGFPETPLGKGKDPAFAGGYAVWSSGRALMVKSAGDPEPRMLAAEGAYAALAGAGPVYAAWESGGEIVVDKLAPQ
jgi:hypothetical protein